MRTFWVLTLWLCGAVYAGDARPNILFIFTDDHAAHALSCYGSNLIQTPNLDRIAKEGMRFDRCFVTNSICTPSRVTLLTGQYSHVNGVPVFNRFDGAKPNVAKHLQAAGYYTAIVGKWHLGSDPTGFDYWNILPGQGAYHNPVLYDKNGSTKYDGHVSDVVTDLTLSVLKNRPSDKPFFMMYHHKAPHRAWQPAERHRVQWADKKIPESPTLFDDYATRTDAIREQRQSIARDLSKTDVKQDPPADLKGDDLTRWKYQRYMQDYLACVQGVDENVGRVLDYLDQNGLAKNTLVIYTSDQGFFLGDNGMYDKRFMYEPSLKMPFLVRWPAVIKAGSTQDAIAINCDFAPTFLDAAGVKVPDEMQGRSLVPLLKGETPADWRTAMYYRYYHDPGHHNTRAHLGIRTASHKLIHFWKKDQWECFDLTKDPHELKNIYTDPAAQPIITQLKEQLAALKKQYKDEDQFSTELPKDGVDGPAPKPAKKE
jgi:arylsulfatase A-like enzyme